MASWFFVVCFVYFQVAHSQYNSIPNYPSYSYNYYPTPTAPTFGPTPPNPPRSLPVSPPKTPKRSVTSPAAACPKCSPKTATAYFLSTPSKKVKATVLPSGKQKEQTAPPPIYTCPLCNNFADVKPNSKIPPPPPIGSPVLPGILDTVPTIVIPKDLTSKDPSSIVLPKMPLLSDMYEKHKLPKNLSFDQELLEGFLTGLGLAS